MARCPAARASSPAQQYISVVPAETTFLPVRAWQEVTDWVAEKEQLPMTMMTMMMMGRSISNDVSEQRGVRFQWPCFS